MRIWFVCVHSDRALVCGCLKSLCVLCASVLPCLRISGVCFDLLFVQTLVNVFVGGPLSHRNRRDR